MAAPTGPEWAVKYTLTGPSGVKAVFNDSTSPDFVGVLSPESSGLDSADVREDATDAALDDGGLHGDFFYGRRPVVLQGTIMATSATQRNERASKIREACDALRSDATLTWKPTGGSEVQLKLRRQDKLKLTGGFVKTFQIPMVSERAPIESAALNAKSATHNVSGPITKHAGKGTTTGVEGEPAWENPENIKTSNNVYSEVFMSEMNSGKLISSTHGFAIPATATIVGIEVLVEKKMIFGTATRPNDTVAKLRKAGVSVGSNLLKAGVWPGVDTVFAYGGPTNLWGTTWTPTDINNTGFGFEIAVNGVAAEPVKAAVDDISIVVYYSIPNPTVEVTNSGNEAVAPAINITGPIGTSFIVENETTGEELVYNGAVASGHVLKIDFEKHTLLDNGVNAFDNMDLVASTWWKINPGTSKIRLVTTGTTSTATKLEVTHRDAWL